jgi:hypothetical protein
MKIVKKLLLAALLCTTIGAQAQVEQITEKQAGISRRLQHEIDATKDPMLGYVPKSRLYNAYTVRKQHIQDMQSTARAPLFSWTERGPYTDAVGPSNGNTRPGNGVTSGRVRAIWQDLSDATGNSVWVGGIDGGIWKTNNINASPATWTPINDFFGNLAVSSICQDPSNTAILYFATGEKSINVDAVRGGGVWQSVDGGVNWNLMPGTETFYNVSKIQCDASGNLYLGNNSLSGGVGMQRYIKASSVWSNITPTGLDTRIPDFDISSTGRLHISCGYFNTASASSGYRYTDNPSTVSSSTWTVPATTFPTNVNVAIASNGNTLYALAANASYEVPTIYKSTNGGANWASSGGAPATGWASGQGWYCLSIAIDPANANNVIVGGLDCHKTTNGGTSWTKISNWVGTTGQYVHADQHITLWNSSNRVIFGCDGGVFVSSNGGTTITDRNVGLRLKQFYSVAVHPTSGSNYFLAGAQDNGTHQLNQAGLSTSVEVTGGDGAYTAIDQDQPQYQFGAYVFNQYRRSTDGGATWSSVNYSSSAGQFINPFDYADAQNILYASGAANTFVRWSNPQTGSTFTAVSMTGLGGGKVTAVKASPYTANVVYFGGGGSGIAATLIKATSANGTPVFTNIIGTGMTTASSRISSIEFGTTEQDIIVSVSNYGVTNVWVTNNGGTTWTAVDGNLPDMPVRWAMFYPGSNTKAIIATETGVWQTELINGASTLWDPETGFPNVRTDMLQYRTSDGLLVAATHGRGIFSTTIGAAPAPCGTPTALNATSVTTNSAIVSWAAVSGATSYDVDYKTNASATWTNAATATTTTTIALNSLSQSTLYDYRIRANCTSGTSAYIAAQFTTTTPATCNAPTGLSATAITTTGATVNWSAVSGAASYDVDYKLSTATTWTNAVTATTTTSRVITGLTASSLYDYRVRANCTAVGLTSTYTQAQFTTSAVASTCPGTLDVSTNGTVAGAATIPFNTDVKGTISASGDVDYYKFVITTGGTATITLSTLPADYDVKLFSSNGTTQLAISQNGSTTSETITRTYTAGTYYIQVYGYQTAANATTCYTLKLQLGTAATQLPIDFVNTNKQKVEVNAFPNPTKDKLSLYILGDNSKRNIMMYDIQGKLIYTQQVNDMITTLDIHKIKSGVYIIKVVNPNGTIEHIEKIIKE